MNAKKPWNLDQKFWYVNGSWGENWIQCTMHNEFWGHAKQTFLFVLTMTTHIVTDLCYMCNHTQRIGVLTLKWAVRLVISRLSATSKMGFKKKKSRWGNQKRQRFVIHLFYMKQGIYKISPWCFFFHFLFQLLWVMSLTSRWHPTQAPL